VHRLSVFFERDPALPRVDRANVDLEDIVTGDSVIEIAAGEQ
jgi:hypothetical protein